METESQTTVEIDGGHTFTVIATTESPDDIVQDGDEQTWVPPAGGKPGRLQVNRKEAFWATKQFNAIARNKYQADYSEDGVDYVIVLLFEKVRDTLDHRKMTWMIYGSRKSVKTGGLLNGPPNWGGQNGQ